MTQSLLQILSLLPPVNSKKAGTSNSGRESLKQALQKLVSFKRSGEGSSALLKNAKTRQPYIDAHDTQYTHSQSHKNMSNSLINIYVHMQLFSHYISK